MFDSQGCVALPALSARPIQMGGSIDYVYRISTVLPTVPDARGWRSKSARSVTSLRNPIQQNWAAVKLPTSLADDDKISHTRLDGPHHN